MANEVLNRILKSRTPVNIPLTNISVAYMQDMNGGATSFFPEVPVPTSTGTYYEFSKDDLLRDDVQRKPIMGKVDPTVVSYNNHNYKCEVDQIILGYDDIVQSDLIRTGAPGLINIRQNKARVIAQKMFIHSNKMFAKGYFKPGVWGRDLVGGMSSADFVPFDNANSDPIGVIAQAKTDIKKETGREPNKLGLGQRVLDYLVQHPDIMSRVIYGGTTSSPAKVTPQALAAIFGLEEVVVFDAIWNTSRLGENGDMQFICDENSMLLCYAAKTPMIDEPTAGYTFRWDMGQAVNASMGIAGSSLTLPIIEWEGEEGTYSHYIGGMMSQDMKVVCKDLGCFFSKAVTPKA